MPEDGIGKDNMNWLAKFAIIVAIVLLFVSAFVFTIVRVAPYYGIFSFFGYCPPQWLDSDWGIYASIFICALFISGILYFGCPAGQRNRFLKSALHWPNLLNGAQAVAEYIVALVRNNVLASAIFAWGVVAVTLMWVGMRSGIPILEFNGGLLIVATVYVCVWAWMVRSEPVILVGAVPGYGIMSLYWIPEVFKQSDTPTQLILLPILPAAVFLFLWIPVQYGLLKCRHKAMHRRRLGPFVETVAFMSLATPCVTAGYFFPHLFMEEPDKMIGPVVALLIGLVWSQLVAAPFARFVKSML